MGVTYSQTLEYRNYKLGNDVSFIETQPGMEKEDYYYLLDKRAVEYAYNEAGELNEYFFMHKKIKVLNDKGIENNNKVYISAGSPEDVMLFNARVINKQGKPISMFKGDLKSVNEEGNNYQVLAIEGIEKGAIIEFFYLKHIGVSHYDRYRFQDDIFRVKSQFEVISPKNLIFKSKSYNGFPNLSDSTANNKNFLKASAYNTPGIKDEKYCFSNKYTYYIDYKLYKNTANNNADIFTFSLASKTYFNSMFEDNLKVSKDVQKLLKTLKSDTIERTIQHVENYIKKNIKVADFVPDNSVGKTIKQGYSTEMGIMKLYARFFEQANIEFQVVMCVPRQEVQIDPSYETWTDLYEHYLFYFPQVDKYISPVNYAVRYPLFDSDMENTLALFIEQVSLGETKSGIGKLKKVGYLPTENSISDMVINIHFTPGKPETSLDVKYGYSGQISVPVRANYFYSSDVDRVVLAESWFKDVYSNCTVSDVKVENFDLDNEEADKEMKMTAKVKTSEIYEKAGENIIINVGKVIGKQEEMYQETERKLDMELGYVHTLKRTLTIDIPQGYTVKNLNEFNYVNEFENTDKNKTGFKSKAEIKNNQIVITVEEYYNSLLYPKSLYESFKKVINSAADFNKLSVIFIKN
jgi:hypothetical protein